MASALQGPRLLKDTVTIKDGVFRLLTHRYSTQYEHFASTKHEPKDDVEAKGYLSLESIHNSVHVRLSIHVSSKLLRVLTKASNLLNRTTLAAVTSSGAVGT